MKLKKGKDKEKKKKNTTALALDTPTKQDYFAIHLKSVLVSNNNKRLGSPSVTVAALTDIGYEY